MKNHCQSQYLGFSFLFSAKSHTPTLLSIFKNCLTQLFGSLSSSLCPCQVIYAIVLEEFWEGMELLINTHVPCLFLYDNYFYMDFKMCIHVAYLLSWNSEGATALLCLLFLYSGQETVFLHSPIHSFTHLFM